MATPILIYLYIQHISDPTTIFDYDEIKMHTCKKKKKKKAQSNCRLKPRFKSKCSPDILILS